MDPGKGEVTPEISLSDTYLTNRSSSAVFCLCSDPGECASHMEYGLALKPLLVWVTSTGMSKSS